jgi:hypothetical protein
LFKEACHTEFNSWESVIVLMLTLQTKIKDAIIITVERSVATADAMKLNAGLPKKNQMGSYLPNLSIIK